MVSLLPQFRVWDEPSASQYLAIQLPLAVKEKPLTSCAALKHSLAGLAVLADTQLPLALALSCSSSTQHYTMMFSTYRAVVHLVIWGGVHTGALRVEPATPEI